jgi:hypothetical protein
LTKVQRSPKTNLA